MSLRSTILSPIEFLVNTPAMRPLASRLLSSWASSMLERKVRIFYDSTWLRTDGDVTIALGPRLAIRRSVIRGWRLNAAELTDLAAGSWYLFYKPAPGDVIVDIGAGMGEDALLFSRSLGERGIIFCFEAHPTTVSCLRKTAEYSNLRNVVAVHGAVFNKHCSIEIDDRPQDEWQANSIMAVDRRGQRATVPVPAFPLDDFEPLQKYSRIDFLKMNIEGAEVDALGGMSKTLAKVRNICVACHDFLADTNPNMRTKAVCQRLLTEAGFTLREPSPGSPPWQQDHVHGVREPNGFASP